MPIYRGTGGAGDSSTDAYASQIAAYAQTATTKANEASASATAAAASATAAAASEAGVDADATAAEAAKTAAEAAQTAAETAQTGAETAETNAGTSATNAASSATAAASSASAASTSATNAASSASAASTSATNAASSATASASSATAAASSASAASTSETNAASSASAASTSATNAATSATNASNSATAAATSATNAASSATAAASSAADAAATAASIGDLDSLSDVTITTPSTGQVLKYNGTIWVNDTDAGGISNVVEDTTPQLGGTLDANGNIIDMGVYTITDAKVGQWDTAYGWGDHSTAGYLTGITGQSIKNLSDVYSSMTPTDGQILTYDTTNGWQAETSASPDTAAVAKAWVAFDPSTDTILDDYNVTSITRNSTGTYTITFDNAFTNTSYCLVSNTASNTTNAGDPNCSVIPMTTTTCKLQIYNTSTQLTSNGDFCSVVAFDNQGELSESNNSV